MKIVKPKIYSIVMLSSALSLRFLWLGEAYSLEEAFDKAEDQANLQSQSKRHFKPEMWAILNFKMIQDLIFNSLSMEIKNKPKKKEKPSKNELMKTIMKNGDKKLYQNNLKKFNINERKLLKDSFKTKRSK